VVKSSLTSRQNKKNSGEEKKRGKREVVFRTCRTRVVTVGGSGEGSLVRCQKGKNGEVVPGGKKERGVVDLGGEKTRMYTRDPPRRRRSAWQKRGKKKPNHLPNLKRKKGTQPAETKKTYSLKGKGRNELVVFPRKKMQVQTRRRAAFLSPKFRREKKAVFSPC